MAPGYAKALIEFINFERRQKSIEKSKEMLFKLYKDALEKGNPDFIAWVSFQYANFMLYVNLFSLTLDHLGYAESHRSLQECV